MCALAFEIRIIKDINEVVLFKESGNAEFFEKKILKIKLYFCK